MERERDEGAKLRERDGEKRLGGDGWDGTRKRILFSYRLGGFDVGGRAGVATATTWSEPLPGRCEEGGTLVAGREWACILKGEDGVKAKKRDTKTKR